jgi:hypothetical protein
MREEWSIPESMSSLIIRNIHVRNIFKILGCQERDDTTHKSIGKAKFTSTEGCTTPGSLVGMHTGQEVARVLYDTMMSLSCP